MGRNPFKDFVQCVKGRRLDDVILEVSGDYIHKHAFEGLIIESRPYTQHEVDPVVDRCLQPGFVLASREFDEVDELVGTGNCIATFIISEEDSPEFKSIAVAGGHDVHAREQSFPQPFPKEMVKLSCKIAGINVAIDVHLGQPSGVDMLL